MQTLHTQIRCCRMQHLIRVYTVCHSSSSFQTHQKDLLKFTDEHISLDKVLFSIQKYSLRKHAYSNILKILPPKNENFQIKYFDIFHISAQNIDCGYSLELPRRGGSNEYPQSMIWAEIRKIMYTPVNPSFTI